MEGDDDDEDEEEENEEDEEEAEEEDENDDFCMSSNPNLLPSQHHCHPRSVPPLLIHSRCGLGAGTGNGIFFIVGFL